MPDVAVGLVEEFLVGVESVSEQGSAEGLPVRPDYTTRHTIESNSNVNTRIQQD